LQRWFDEHDVVGRPATVGELGGFEQGFSGELLTFDLICREDGAEHREGMVVRIEPDERSQLFLDPNFEGQYRVMEALSQQTSVRLPRPVGFEADPEVLGARFFVMERVPGRTGMLGMDWMNEIGEQGRERTWWNGLAAMAELHRTDLRGLGLDFLDQPVRGADPIDQQLQYYWEYLAWASRGESHPVMEAAYDWLRSAKPRLPPVGIVWGDAKRGNQLFTENLEVSALLDLEMVCLGPAEEDLAFWLEGEHQTAELFGLTTPTIEETIARYGELIGRDIAGIGYYLVFAAFRIAVIRIKRYHLREGDPRRGEPDVGEKRLATLLATFAGGHGVRR
jgi:aminoglycoside phosphotransferase (APT) family kinase protein